MSLTTRRWLFLIVTSVTVFVLDRVSKTIIVSTMAMFESRQPIPALAPYFQIVRSYNTGSAFGFMAGTAFASNLFLVLALVVTGVLIWSYPRIADGQPLARVATALIIGGALGNAVDRLIYGHVVDFINYQIPNVISNVSNIADHAIVLGVILMIWSGWQAERQPETADPNTEIEQERGA